MENKNFDVIVIGSGMGGMACASALAQTNHRVLLLEQHFVLGGMTHTFKRKNFEWDVGVHCVGEMSPKRMPGKLIRWLTDNQLEFNMYHDVYDSFHFPENFDFDLHSTKEKFKQNLLEKFPEEKDGIEKYLELVNVVGKTAKSHFVHRLMPRWLEKISAPLFDRKFTHWASKTTDEVVDGLIKNPKLKAVLVGQWGYYGLPPSRSSFFVHAIVVRHFWEGGYYPVGSSKAIAEKMKAVIEKVGGKCLTRTSVEELIVEGNKATGVVTQKGERYFAPVVISAAGAKATVEKIVPVQEKRKAWVTNINKLDQSPCHLCLYLGFEGDITKLGVSASNQWFFETWDPEIMHWDVEDKNSIAPVLYVSFPSLKDPNHPKDAPHTGEVVTFVPWETFQKWQDSTKQKRPGDYKAFKEEIETRMLDQLWKHLPQLKSACVFTELSTPLSTTHYCRAPKGAIYGLSPTPERFLCRDLRPETPIKGFYMTGGDIGTLGVIGAMIGGVLTAAKVDKKVMKQLQ